MENNNTSDNSAKFAFFYLLSLVALLFMALSTGMVLFQIINKLIPETVGFYSGSYSSGAMKFGISALVVSAPVFYVITARIHKNLYQGKLSVDSAIRRWLTYLILFVSSVVMIIWVIITINSFLDGELTLKFALKFLTVLIIAGTVFGFYLYDIKRENIQGSKDRVIKAFFWGTLIIVVGVFVSSLFVVESPWEARANRLDQETLRDLSSLEARIDGYYKNEERLPSDLEELIESEPYLTRDNITAPGTEEEYEYNITGEKEYQLCAEFKISNKDGEEDYYLNREWSHGQGRHCFDLKVRTEENNGSGPTPKPVQ